MRIDKMQEVVLNYYGIDNQLIKAKEELSELSIEIDKYMSDCGVRVDLISEIADVENMLEEIKMYYKLNLSVDNVKRQKMERELKRIQKIKEG